MELMVVIAIIGVIGLSVGLSVGRTDRNDVMEEAERFSRLAELASQTAVVRGIDIAIVVEPDGYHFQQREFEDWADVEELEPLLKPHALSSSIQAHLRLFGQSASSEVGKPLLVFQRSGEIPPFELGFSDKDGGGVVRLVGHPTGRFVLEARGGG